MQRLISRRLLALLFSLICLLGFGTYRPVQVKADTQAEFIDTMKPTVIRVAKKYNLYASLMLAQAALESGYGQSQLATQADNYFGIKGAYNGQSVTMTTGEYTSLGRKYTTTAQFKKYPNPQSSFNDYAELLRNGLVGNTSFYSGSWKENATSVQAAVASLVGKYATDPNYATNLLNIINTYGLSSMDQGITVESNPVAQNDNRNLKPTTSATNKKTSNNTPLVKITYTKGADQTIPLSAAYPNQVLYATIPNTKTTKSKTFKWGSKTINTNSVFVDMMGKDKVNHQTWYRIRSTNGAKQRYWVQADALLFPTFRYSKFNGKINANDIKDPSAYTHVLASAQLATKVNNAAPASNGAYEANMIATDTNDATNNWIRYKTSNNQQVWVRLSSVHTVQASNSKLMKSLKAEYGKYKLYTKMPTNNNTPTVAWSTLKLTTIDLVAIKSTAVRFSDHSLWYEIELDNHKYWISANALQ